MIKMFQVETSQEKEERLHEVARNVERNSLNIILQMKSRDCSETTSKTRSCYGDLEIDTIKLSIPFRSGTKN